jgi:DNA polymerase elongation subunit (family B)
MKIPLSFEGRYRWIVFLPSKVHPGVGVLNRYYGAMENGKIKVRGL